MDLPSKVVMDIGNTAAMIVLNAANIALRNARYAVRAENYAEADREVAVAAAMIRILQIAKPVPERPDPPSRSMGHPMKSFSGVAEMFRYQMLRWNVSADQLDDGLYTED